MLAQTSSGRSRSAKLGVLTSSGCRRCASLRASRASEIAAPSSAFAEQLWLISTNDAVASTLVGGVRVSAERRDPRTAAEL